MKTLSLTFGIIGILLLLLGLYILFINYNQNIFFWCFGSGFVAIGLYLLIDKIINDE